jgi:peptidoglycan/LPS O-acetylase OafA/YrhL
LGKLLTLQAARAVAANLVVLSHLAVVDKKYLSDALPPWASYGIAGVDLFFVLSGFVMVAIAGRSITAPLFLWRRAIRIYPTYWIVSGVVLAVSLLSPELVNASVKGPISIWRSFLLIPQNTLPLLAVGWTLIHEVYFYLVFALILFLRISVAAALVAWASVLLAAAHALPAELVAASPFLRVLLSPLTAEFMMGAAIGELYRRNIARFAPASGLMGLAAIVVAIGWLAPSMALASSADLDTWRVAVFGVPCALIIYGLAGWELRATPEPAPLLVALGDASYATYLVHVLVVSALGRAIALALPHGAVASVLLLSVGLAAANLAGATIFMRFERPLLLWLKSGKWR